MIVKELLNITSLAIFGENWTTFATTSGHADGNHKREKTFWRQITDMQMDPQLRPVTYY